MLFTTNISLFRHFNPGPPSTFMSHDVKKKKKKSSNDKNDNRRGEFYRDRNGNDIMSWQRIKCILLLLDLI